MTTEHDKPLGDFADGAEELDLDALGWAPKPPIQDTWAEPIFWTVVFMLMIYTPQWVGEWVDGPVASAEVTTTQAQKECLSDPKRQSLCPRSSNHR